MIDISLPIEWINFLALLGAIVAAALVLAGFGTAFVMVRDLVRQLKCNYAIKHRFDHPPTAECYCKFCKNWNSKTHRCCLPGVSRCTPDDGFCYEAEPRADAIDILKEKEEV